MEYNFRNQHELFYVILQDIKYHKQDDLESYVHALLDIEESVNKIFNVLIKEILENEKNKEFIIEKIWEIREEFRHIDYHINDAKLTE